jgi:hypothetical protein
VHSGLFLEGSEFQDLLQAAGLWIFVRRSGLAGLLNKYCLAPMVEIVPLSTSQGNYLHHYCLRTHFKRCQQRFRIHVDQRSMSLL